MVEQPAPRPRAVITGASSGIGAAFAAALARDHFDLVLIARSQERLEMHARRLRVDCGVTVDVVVADLSCAEQLRAAETRVAGQRELDLLVNNAGAASVGPFARLDPDQEEALVGLNTLAPVRLTRAALPGMMARRRGAIINVSSIAAFIPARYTATYCGTKAAVNSFTEALHEELRGSGVRVQLLCPGFTRTEFCERAGVDAGAIPSFAWMEPQAVVAASLAALQRGQLVCVPGAVNGALSLGLRVLPRRLMRRLTGAAAKQGWASSSLRNRSG